jgi:hypothetical protein
MTPGAALDSLVSSIVRDNPGLTAGPQSEISVNGVTAQSIECNNPTSNNGRGEHDWIVAFRQKDQTLRYFVFVSPAGNAEQARPIFQKILQSARLG